MTEMSNAPNSWRDWTSRGGEVDSGFADRLDRLEKRWRNHLGIDWSAAGPDYPHPSQKVRALYFFEGNGRLDPSGIQFKDNDPSYGAGNNPGIFWVAEYTDDPFNNSKGALYGDLGTNDAEVKLEVTPTNYLAGIDLYGGTASNAAKVTLTAKKTSPLNIAQALLQADATFGNYLWIINAPLRLDSDTADFTILADGEIWYRSDLGRIRARLNGVTYNLATTADIPSVPTQFNIWPYVAKTTTYTTTATDGFIRADATSASFTITLITAVGNTGLIQVFKKIDGTNNTITLDASSTQTIDGALTYVLAVEDESVTLISDGANWQIMGSNTPVSYSAKTGNYTVILRDTFINFDCTSGALTATLPTAVGCAGHEVTIRKSDTGVNALTVDGNGSQTIGGATTYVITSPGALTIVSNGANWEIKARPASAYLAVTTTYTTTIADQVLAISAAGGAYTITLVPVAGNAGLIQTFIKTTSTNTITLDGNASETINGALSYALTNRHTKVSLLCTGAAWIVMNED